MDEADAEGLTDRYPFLSSRQTHDCLSFSCPPEKLADFSESLRDVEGFEMLVDATGVDWGLEVTPRFSTVYHFYSLVRRSYLRLNCECPDDESPEVPSISGVYPAADWHEREIFDMFGISFSGHGNLKRILMWDSYPYHPLRKDFPLAGIEVPLPADDVAEVTEASVEPAPMMGGPFVSPPHGRVSEAEPRAKDESWTEELQKPS